MATRNDFQDLVATGEHGLPRHRRRTASLRTDPDARHRLQRIEPKQRPGPPRPDHHPRRPGRAAVEQRRASAGSSRSTSATSSRPTSNVFYNGVTAGTNANTLKAIEAGWVATGYPGPAFPPVTSPPDPNDQVAIIDGQLVRDHHRRDQRALYGPGRRSSSPVYSGTVMTIPDFALTVALDRRRSARPRTGTAR